MIELTTAILEICIGSGLIGFSIGLFIGTKMRVFNEIRGYYCRRKWEP
jgi:hypothetical protein